MIAFIIGAFPVAVWAQSTIELRRIDLEPATEGLLLSANIQLELAPSLEEALRKGVALTFVAQAQVLRDRWYWYDKAIATRSRNIGLSYQPLTQRWRLSVASGDGDAANGASLRQSFDQLPAALAAIGRISNWKIADSGEVETDAKHSVAFSFKLDLNQLPRPMQIGIGLNTDWNLAVQKTLRLQAR